MVSRLFPTPYALFKANKEESSKHVLLLSSQECTISLPIFWMNLALMKIMNYKHWWEQVVLALGSHWNPLPFSLHSRGRSPPVLGQSWPREFLQLLSAVYWTDAVLCMGATPGMRSGANNVVVRNWSAGRDRYLNMCSVTSSHCFWKISYFTSNFKHCWTPFWWARISACCSQS